jgi:hypothetical protein
MTPAHVDVRHWGRTTAGQRGHGTTQEPPLERVEAVERAQLKPLPTMADDLAVWTRVTRQRDGYVVCAQAFSSAPFRLMGPPLWVRGGSQAVRRATTRDALVATHPRAPRAGARMTHRDHVPPEKIPGAFWTREGCQALAAAVGPATVPLVETRLAAPVLDRRPRVIRVLTRRERVGPSRLEAACARALDFGDLTSQTLTRLLARGLEAAGLPALTVPAPAATFVRTAAALLGELAGGASRSSTTSEPRS